ncbi:conserved hypothetical protein [Methanococcus maripaludis C5]|uniref:BioF2-like acetyltransferase domain-containing protein n=1 Tax=Methanococcus maripaludis (strain C5 / ATCC BAA-1333) TaxID=402880 RepID=A4FX88_METM5|nr:GNAT family N-acetyltransferase [Methanococcus maripaludis]ABO34817.1 conserved hypothetical protein [Methanococcus maripaludis C5]
MEIIRGEKEWNKLIKSDFENYNDVYFNYGYFNLYKMHYGTDFEGIFWEDRNIKIFLSHLIRDICKIKNLENFDGYDLTTPYGYGGPIIVKKTNEPEKIRKSISDFEKEYQNYCLDEKYICEFFRFHPIYENHICFSKIFNTQYLSDIRYIDLNQNIDTIKSNFKKGLRYNIKKSKNEGCDLKIIENPSSEDIDHFMECYNSMLCRNESSEKYHFSKQFIMDHFKFIKTFLILAYYQKKVVGAGIFFKGETIMHYHLSGTLKLKGIYPNDLILWESIKKSKDLGLKYFFLGGGVIKDDSLFEYKSGFSKLDMPFYIGKKIYDQNKYNQLVKHLNLVKPLNKDYFPEYRTFDSTIV